MPNSQNSDNLVIDKSSWYQLQNEVQRLTQNDIIPAISLKISSQGQTASTIYSGRSRIDGDDSVSEETLFLVASVTKPIFATAIMMLVERGLISINQKASHYFPEFKSRGLHVITIRELLTHTSGLPDMLPNNLELRKQNAPLSKFWKHVCELTTDYTPGTAARYQSMGFVVLDQLIQKVTQLSSQDFLKQELFEPLGMLNTHLGLPENAETSSLLNRRAEVRLRSKDENPDGDWNSNYWLTLGAPWGGMISTADDLTRFCQMILNEGQHHDHKILGASTIHSAISNQLGWFESMNERDKTHRPWGFGWRGNWPTHRYTLCELAGESIRGHWGATGCLMWINPEKKQSLVLCSTEPTDTSMPELQKLSNMVFAML